MTTIQVSVPEDTFSTVRRSPDEVAREMRLAVALLWYQRGLVSQEKAAEIADLPRSELIDALGSQRISASQESLDDIREVLSRA